MGLTAVVAIWVLEVINSIAHGQLLPTTNTACIGMQGLPRLKS